MAPPYIKRVLVLLITLLGTAHAPAPGGSNACAADGSSASYSETISMAQGVTKRTIVTNGCPNHESYCTGKPGPAPTCKDKGEQGSDTEAIQQDVNVDIPANPILKSSYTPGELDCSMGAIAYALNGIGFYSGAVGYDENGNCPQLDVADPEAEWISFDCCTGHSDYEYAYHYHFPPSCLLAQANKAAPISDGHSAQVGWAQDGFPIYGPLGPGGVEIRNCGTSGAHATYCQDECGGYEGELPGVDNYKYRYYITGKVGDLNTLPSTPMPDSEELYYPYTIRCYRGCTIPSTPTGISDFKSCEGTDGFTSAHTATALDGYTTPLAVQCQDGNTYTDYGFTEAVITPVDTGGDVTEDTGGDVTEDPTNDRVAGASEGSLSESDAAVTRAPRQFAVAGAAALVAAIA